MWIRSTMISIVGTVFFTIVLYTVSKINKFFIFFINFYPTHPEFYAKNLSNRMTGIILKNLRAQSENNFHFLAKLGQKIILFFVEKTFLIFYFPSNQLDNFITQISNFLIKYEYIFDFKNGETFHFSLFSVDTSCLLF